ncbi:MAG: hypothetical protein HON70_41720, partial [Lentisphaerae bacterium]|nr:hypothetical protein [Lentisphaerota bacterium]
MPHVAQNPSAVRDFAPADLPDVPDLAGLQKVSFERFLQAQTPSDERASQGLEELLRQSIAAEGAFDFLGYELVPGDLTPAECQRFGRSYAAVLQVRIASGEHGEALADAGSIPLMTGRGTFIVNGVEKVVVGCLQAQEDTLENDLSTRRLLLVGEQLRLALAGPAASDAANFQVEESPGFPALARTIREFFAGSAFVRIAETRNPLTLASQLRLVMQTGVEKRPGYRARCPHPTHFGRLGLLETPEGGRIGINLATAILADVDESGRLLAPFSRSPDGEQITQLLPEEDTSYIIGDLADSQVQSRYGGGTLARVGDDLHRVSDSPELTPVHPQQHLGVSAALIPFIAHDDANRALMGANMQKQAMPLRDPEAPLVQTGLEAQVIRDMAPASGSCSDAGVLALGRNLLTAFMCWEGYNFEDGIVVSEDVVRHGLLDTVQVREYTVAIREGKSESLREDELVATGAAVSGGDVLIARTKQRASGQEQDTSVRLPRGMTGTVTSVEHHRARDGAPLAAGVSEFVRVRVEAQRPLRVGDKLCTRHGAKGVVTTVVPTEDMPMLPDGRRVQVLMNPLGVPSRMNIGVLLETHLGMAAHELGITVTTPGFCGASVRDIETLLREAGCPESGMYRLRDGRNGRPFDQETTVGYIYVLRLDQMVEDKRQERSVGPRDQGTSQPVSGRRNGGGQRVGIMETWALQGHGASHILWEMLTVKSDDVAAQEALYDALVNGGPLPRATVCESVKRLVKQLRGLCLDLQLLDSAGDAIDILRGDPHISGVMTARLQFASADRILAWSGDEVTSLEEDELSNGHIRLASPVAHAWRTLAPDLDTCELTCLPTIPRELRGGARLDAAYAAVLEANSECREKNGADGTAEALQGAVDGLLNGLTRLLYGKKGWITTAMSGKSVDYSARSVVCPGPELDYDTCSLPIATAAVLFEPFAVGEIIRS